MKTELREVKKMMPVYIAEDGTEFINKQKCAEYETRLALEEVIMLNSDFEITDDLNIADYIYLKDEETARIFVDYCDRENIETLGLDEYRPGYYEWRCDRWYNLEDERNEIRKKIDLLLKARKVMFFKKLAEEDKKEKEKEKEKCNENVEREEECEEYNEKE